MIFPSHLSAVPGTGSHEAPRATKPTSPVHDFATVHAAYFGRIESYARRMTGDAHAAEDLAQDVFLQVHRVLPRRGVEREVQPWLYAIATNKIKDWWRWRSRRSRELDTSRDDQHAASTVAALDAEPDASCERRELNKLLHLALDRVPESMRLIVFLRAYEGLSTQAVAELLGRSPQAIRKRYARGVKLLREIVANLENPEGEAA